MRSDLTLPLPYLNLPYGEGALPRSSEASSGPNARPELTFRLLEPLGVFSKLQECAPMLLS